jgi:hypothetical protein
VLHVGVQGVLVGDLRDSIIPMVFVNSDVVHLDSEIEQLLGSIMKGDGTIWDQVQIWRIVKNIKITLHIVAFLERHCVEVEYLLVDVLVDRGFGLLEEWHVDCFRSMVLFVNATGFSDNVREQSMGTVNEMSNLIGTCSCQGSRYSIQ